MNEVVNAVDLLLSTLSLDELREVEILLRRHVVNRTEEELVVLYRPVGKLSELLAGGVQVADHTGSVERTLKGKGFLP